MLKKLYQWLYKATSRPDERGEYFGGCLEGFIRSRALELCRGATGKALEIGFGSGLFMLKLASQEPGLEVWGVDSSESYRRDVEKKAAERKLSNVRLAVGDARRLSFPDGTFDRVVCINLFIDLGYDAMGEVLAEMKRVCKEDGRVIFEFRSSRNALFVLKYKLARYYDDTAPYPLHTFDPDKVDALLGQVGLKAVRKSFLGFPVKRFAPIIMIEAEKI